MERLLLLLQFEILYKIGLPVQRLNLFNIIAVFLLLNLKYIKRSPLFILLLFFCLYSLFITLFNIYIYIVFYYKILDKEIMLGILRQLAGLFVGISTYLSIREIFRSGRFSFLKYSVASILLILISVLVFDVILEHKFFRIEATFTEPSHLGQFLVFVVLPSILLVRRQVPRYVLLFLVLTLIFMTFSFTTYVRFIIFLLYLFLFSERFLHKFKIMIIILLITTIGFALFFLTFPNSYVVYQVEKNIQAIFFMNSIEHATASLIDRMQILFIILNFASLGLNSIIGIGLGFERLYMTVIYPEDVLNTVLSAKQFPSYINSFWGKIILYNGVIGFLIFLYVLYISFRVLRQYCKAKNEIYIIRSTLFAIYTYALIGLAPFQSTELWFWLAFIDAYYLKHKNWNYLKCQEKFQ